MLIPRVPTAWLHPLATILVLAPHVETALARLALILQLHARLVLPAIIPSHLHFRQLLAQLLVSSHFLAFSHSPLFSSRRSFNNLQWPWKLVSENPTILVSCDRECYSSSLGVCVCSAAYSGTFCNLCSPGHCGYPTCYGLSLLRE